MADDIRLIRSNKMVVGGKEIAADTLILVGDIFIPARDVMKAVDHLIYKRKLDAARQRRNQAKAKEEKMKIKVQDECARV